MSNEVAIKDTQVVNFEDYTRSIESITGQIKLIHSAMEKAMKKDEHYGIIPGCGNKPALLKPGAEKISALFRLAPKYEIEERDLGGGHREYRIICSLWHIPTNTFQGQGLGLCSTIETKFRYRWKNGARIEHDNPADNYNTCLKMGKKRAHVDAVLTVTAASDIFAQDIEDLSEEKPETPAKQQPKSKPSAQNRQTIDRELTEKVKKLVAGSSLTEEQKGILRSYAKADMKLTITILEELQESIIDASEKGPVSDETKTEMLQDIIFTIEEKKLNGALA